MMIRRAFIGIFLTLAAWTTTTAQDIAPSLSIEFLSNDQVSNINFKQGPFEVHAKNVAELLEAYFADFEKAHEIVVLETFTTDSMPQFSIHARPAMFVNDMEELGAKLSKIKGVKALFADFHLAYIIETKGGVPGKNAAYVPEFKVPIQREFEALQAATLIGMRENIQEWARTGVLPILGAFEENVADKFEGVKTVGILTSTTDLSMKKDVLALTEGNPDYWRGVIEMSAGNQLVIASKIFMHVANGEFDYIGKYLEVISFFTDPKTIGAYYFKELQWRLDIFQAELTAQVNGGIMMHDAKRYAKSIETYQRILQDYPGSASAMWELYRSSNTLRIRYDEIDADDRTDWNVFREKILMANPFYLTDMEALTAKEEYLISRRKQITELFVKEKEFTEDFITLADISLDLEIYGFAAHLYWMLISSIPKAEYPERELIPYFLYCLDKIGDKKLIGNFEGDHDTDFTRIAEERKQLMLESSVYQMFNDTE
ncbi:MAG TPA: hypothetical protein EYN41_04425 [Flavobacteriales bacterium]|nr:hypothetical protein [Flavobacteriales bacterium]